MFVHHLRFRFKDSATEDECASALAAVRRIGNMHSVSFSFMGQDLGDPSDGFTHAYCVGIADLDALDRYLNDPVHLEGDPWFLPHLAKLAVLGLSDDLDPQLGEKIAALVQKKATAHPEWMQLMQQIPQVDIRSDAR
jgi:hypothetical protein